MLSQAQVQAITGGGQDVTIIPSMDGKSMVDVEPPLAEAVPPRDCRFLFAETDTFGTDVEDFHKTSFQYPPRRALISEAAAAYRDGGPPHSRRSTPSPHSASLRRRVHGRRAGR